MGHTALKSNLRWPAEGAYILNEIKSLISGEKFFIYEEQRFFLESDSKIRTLAQMADLYPDLTNKNMIECCFFSRGICKKLRQHI